ncbi:MAG: DUF4326 domain-containing protein [Chloroflexi bacterium]|nr:MAG: DUF4326 domain-containing protein [Chloroflexota bacterium]
MADLGQVPRVHAADHPGPNYQDPRPSHRLLHVPHFSDALPPLNHARSLPGSPAPRRIPSSDVAQRTLSWLGWPRRRTAARHPLQPGPSMKPTTAGSGHATDRRSNVAQCGSRELREKALGCWCAPPACHAGVLIAEVWRCRAGRP